MNKNAPVTVLDERQKLIAVLVAVGKTDKQISEAIPGVTAAFVRVLRQGTLFQIEVDEARRRLVNENIKSFVTAMTEELPTIKNELLKIVKGEADKKSDVIAASRLILDKLPMPTNHDVSDRKPVEVNINFGDSAPKVAEIIEEGKGE